MDTNKQQLTQQITREVARILAMPSSEISSEAPLIEYGLDSIQSTDLVVGIEEMFDIQIADDDLPALRCVDDIADRVIYLLSER